MKEYVEVYVRACLVCQLDKVERKKEAGLLQPLPIPEGPRQSVSMDFITGFPKVNSMASILIVVDRFSKYGIFIVAPYACPTETAAELFFKYVTTYFGVPRDIISDGDTKFIGQFWTAMFNMLGTELKFSTANYPQTDGQTERVNALVEDYLRHYVTANQRNLVILLDLAQFSYNLHKSSSAGMGPFELVYGQQPMMPHEVPVQKLGDKCPAAYRFARSKQELLYEAKDSLAKAQRRMKKYADKGRRHVEYSVGDQVLLKLTPNLEEDQFQDCASWTDSKI
ncbi:UNVERIFIED_CONTAM: Transposon Ty3-I Gag-Pol polyprotein [Sesamum latifolium]|uniref:Transposon Ty3-I Gag-Pol polyprotein n=1 Tax=Sesamum latifolium TaxID=2727402 RepID=A0AAW2WEX2_9LAMI